MKISIFDKFPAKKGDPHLSSGSLSIEDFLNQVKYGHWKDQIENIRIEKDKKKRDWMKRNIPAVTISGLFQQREEDHLLEHSGFLAVDIDNYNDKESLKDDKYTYALFHSASGNGIVVIVKVKPEKHKESYRWLAEYYYAHYGISVDLAPQNPASLRYVTYDPDLFINEKSLLSRTRSRKPKKIKALPLVFEEDEVGQMVNEVVTRFINIAPDYETYRNLGFALANGFGENGRDYFHSLCSVSEKYDSQQANKQYDRCLRGGNKSGITVGTFYYLLKENGIDFPVKNKKAIQIAAMGKKSNRLREAVTAQLIKMEGLNESEAQKITDQVYDRDDISIREVSSDPEELITALSEWMTMNHPVRLNTITRMPEEKGKELKKEQFNSIWLRARIYFNTKDITPDLVERLIISEFTPEFNPITEYIDQNRNLNTNGNVERFITSIRTDTPNADLMIRKWLLSIIAAHDGYPVRSVLALVGGQNTGKTEWFRRLLPEKLKRYYAESKLDAGKDDEMLMCQKLIVMDDEMGGKSKQDEKRFKELTSKSVFSLRAPYARYNEDFKRLAILCGTSNDPNIVNDPTGNTRVLPINVQSIDHELYNSINKDELFMELVRMYERGEEWQLNKEDLARLAELSSDFEVIPFEREMITKFFKNQEHRQQLEAVEWLTSSEIKDYIEGHSKQKFQSLRRFGLELRNVLGEAKQKKIDGINQKRYACVKIKHDNTGYKKPEPEIKEEDGDDTLPF